MVGSIQKPKGAEEEADFMGFEETEILKKKDITKIWLEMSSEDESEEDVRVQLTDRGVVCNNMFCTDINCGDSVVHGKQKLQNNIQEIINTADLQRISSKDIRLMVQEKLKINLEASKKEFDKVVIEVFKERSDFVNVKPSRPKVSAKAKKEKLKLEKKDKQGQYEAAARSWLQGNHKSVAECARVFEVDRRVLYAGIVKRNGEFPGSGKFTTVLSPKEETKVYNHIVHMTEIGFGPSWSTLRLLLQEAMHSLKAVNPNRITGFESRGQMPSIPFVRRFADRHSLSLRKSSVISSSRAEVSPKKVSSWFSEIGNFLAKKPEIKEAIQDPARVFNQDETAVELGVGSQWVLAPKGTKQVYTQSSNYKEHVTVSYTVSAKGDMVPPRVVHSGVRLIAPNKPCIANMPKDGLSKEWGFSVSENGWVKHDQMLEIIQDLSHFMEENNILKPTVLFLDGASCHISLKISETCDKAGIQPILLLPNSTHLLQPLDVTVFSPFKASLKRELELWQRSIENVGKNLNKYEVIPLVYGITENMLTTKPLLISKGFRKTGLQPWDPTAPNTEGMKASQIYKANSTDKHMQQGQDDSTAGQVQVELMKKVQFDQIKQVHVEHVEQVQVEHVKQVQLEHVTEVHEDQVKQVQDDYVKQLQVEHLKKVQVEHVKQVQNAEVMGPKDSLQTGKEMNSGQPKSYQGVHKEFNISTPSTETLTEKLAVPEDSQRFLSGMEHLLSKQELETFQKLFASGNLTYHNLPYQAWLVLKQGLIPQAQSAALDQVTMIIH